MRLFDFVPVSSAVLPVVSASASAMTASRPEGELLNFLCRVPTAMNFV